MQLGNQGLVVVVGNLGRGDANAGTEARLNKGKNEYALAPVRLDLLLRQAFRLEKLLPAGVCFAVVTGAFGDDTAQLGDDAVAPLPESEA